MALRMPKCRAFRSASRIVAFVACGGCATAPVIELPERIFPALSRMIRGDTRHGS